MEIIETTGKTPEYIGLMAATWDLFRGDTSEWADRFFFKEAVSRYGQPVLDVGCGTGRLLLDFLADGVDMDGVDNSAEMLRLCREKAASRGLSPTLYEGEMDTLSLPRRYQTIIVPSSSFQLLTNDSAAKAALQRFYDHLLPGGVLIMSLMQFWQEGEGLDSGWFASGEAIGADEVTYRRFARHTVTPETQCDHSETRYERWENGEKTHEELHKRSPATRWYTRHEAIALYREVGLTEIEAFHDFTFDPASPDDTLFCLKGKRPK